MERVKANQRHISSVSRHTLISKHGFKWHLFPFNAHYLWLSLCRPVAAVLLGLQANARPDVLSQGDARDHPRQRERQEDQ